MSDPVDHWGMTYGERAALDNLAGRLAWHYSDCSDIIKVTERYSGSPCSPPNFVTVSLVKHAIEIIFLQRTDWAQERSETWHMNINNNKTDALVADDVPGLDYTGPLVIQDLDYALMWAVSQIERVQSILCPIDPQGKIY